MARKQATKFFPLRDDVNDISDKIENWVFADNGIFDGGVGSSDLKELQRKIFLAARDLINTGVCLYNDIRMAETHEQLLKKKVER